MNANLVDEIRKMITSSRINENDFYKTFQKEILPLDIVKTIFQQYYYYIRTFPRILSGLAPRVSDELIRLKICRTVVSELGDGKGDAHYIMFEKVLTAIGISLDDYENADYNQETKDLIENLNRLFLFESPNYALGAHYVIEEFGFPMIVNLYEGFRLYKGWQHEDYNYFYLHILIECNHVDWIQEAMLAAAKNDDSKMEIIEGARQVLESLNNFWSGLNRLATTNKDYAYKDFN
ncbi:iron-containing redox enzyme family protein [Providencia stuartii]|uniref:TenA family transcriptional regulator n=1 Tax=Providencia TaxID=586 RepID=UPI0024B15B19|nr:iron-containing redox enzyme family protein [Providencia sp. 2023EL-00965]ELR5300696.1 iron-containing redox enzyme family protein [Providencia stuartii]MDW7589681.1 iron-containing redox enzyme family protein [Providencia sp. 2023EL-00965]